MRVKEENAKAGLKLNNIKKKLDHGIQSHHFVANRKGKVETVTDFIFGSSKSLWTVTVTKKLKAKQNKQKRKHLILGRKTMTDLDSILKSRDITLLTKVCIVKVMIFPVVMYGCDHWIIKKAEH